MVAVWLIRHHGSLVESAAHFGWNPKVLGYLQAKYGEGFRTWKCRGPQKRQRPLKFNKVPQLRRQMLICFQCCLGSILNNCTAMVWDMTLRWSCTVWFGFSEYKVREAWDSWSFKPVCHSMLMSVIWCFLMFYLFLSIRCLLQKLPKTCTLVLRCRI